ncbi:MAG: hypothetical protein ACWGOX_05805 [Desulforhopalus sp.]
MFYKKISFICFLGLLCSLFPLSGYANRNDTEVILTDKDDKILAFSAEKNHWVPEDKRLSEKIVKVKSQGNIGIVVTTKRIIGFSVITDKWTSEDLKFNERIEEIKVEGNAATMNTNIRVIGFSAHSGQWIEAP